MSWTKIDDRLLSHVKMRRARARMGDAALAMWTSALVFSNQHELDGLVYGDMLGDFTSHADPRAVADALVEVGLWLSDGSDYRVHDYDKYNETRAQRERKRAEERQRKADAVEKKRLGKRTGVARKGSAGEEQKQPSTQVNAAPPAPSESFRPESERNNPDSTAALNPLTIPNHPYPSLTSEGPPAGTTAALVAALESCPSLARVATRQTAEALSPWVDGGGKKIEWVIAAIQDFGAQEAIVAGSVDGPTETKRLAGGLRAFVAAARPPRASEDRRTPPNGRDAPSLASQMPFTRAPREAS